VLCVTVEHLPQRPHPAQDDVAMARRARPAVTGRAVARLPGPFRGCRTRLPLRQGTPACSGSPASPSGVYPGK
jgi:hypothetical protein